MARAGLVREDCGKLRAWSVDDLANAAGVSPRSIVRFELGEKVRLETVEALRSALVKAGALFVEVEGRSGVAVKVKDQA